MANLIYNNGLEMTYEGEIDWEDDTIKALLVDDTHSSDETDVFITDCATLGEIDESGYSRQTLASVTVTQDDANNRIYIDATDPAFGSIVTGGTIAGMILYKFVSSDADSILLCFFDLTNTPTNGAAVTVTFPVGGFWLATRKAGS